MKQFYFKISDKSDNSVLYDSKQQGHPSYISEFIAEQIADDIIGFVLQKKKCECNITIIPCLDHIVSQCTYMEHNLY